MRTGCTQLWEFIGLLWSTQFTRWVFVPWRICAAQPRCVWWCLCCNYWLCFIALIIVFTIVFAIVFTLTILIWIIAFICEFLCIIGVVASGRGTCLVFSAPPASGTTPPANAAPTANAGGPYSGRVGVPVLMSATASTDPEGAALTASWNFGDGATATGLTVSHAYGNVGVFNVTVSVSDGTNTATAATTANIVLIGGGPGEPPVDTP